MRGCLLFFLWSVWVYACSGDCLNCHPGLIKESGTYDKDHAVLRTCIRCHSSHQSGNANQCGADCWECHNAKELSRSDVKEHQALEACTACHLKLALQKAPKLKAAPFLNF